MQELSLQVLAIQIDQVLSKSWKLLKINLMVEHWKWKKSMKSKHMPAWSIEWELVMITITYSRVVKTVA